MVKRANHFFDQTTARCFPSCPESLQSVESNCGSWLHPPRSWGYRCPRAHDVRASRHLVRHKSKQHALCDSAQGWLISSQDHRPQSSSTQVKVGQLYCEFVPKLKIVNYKCKRELVHFNPCQLNFELALVKCELAQHWFDLWTWFINCERSFFFNTTHDYCW